MAQDHSQESSVLKQLWGRLWGSCDPVPEICIIPDSYPTCSSPAGGTSLRIVDDSNIFEPLEETRVRTKAGIDKGLATVIVKFVTISPRKSEDSSFREEFRS